MVLTKNIIISIFGLCLWLQLKTVLTRACIWVQCTWVIVVYMKSLDVLTISYNYSE